MIAGILLLFLPPRRAMYVLHIIVSQILTACMSSESRALLTEFKVLDLLIKKRCPAVYEHLQHDTIDSQFYSVRWFCCMFCGTDFPMETLFRVWYAI